VPPALKDAERRFLETRSNTRLNPSEKDKVHLIELKAGNTYVLDLESTEFNTVLKLEEPGGKQLAKGNHFDNDAHQARIVFSPTADAVYRIVVTSYWGTSSGIYTLRVREFLK
jgi:hypothetical protein